MVLITPGLGINDRVVFGINFHDVNSKKGMFTWAWSPVVQPEHLGTGPTPCYCILRPNQLKYSYVTPFHFVAMSTCTGSINQQHETGFSTFSSHPRDRGGQRRVGIRSGVGTLHIRHSGPERARREHDDVNTTTSGLSKPHHETCPSHSS